MIVNSPYCEPKQYWSYNRNARRFALKDGRRPAGYIVASQDSQSFDDPGLFVEIPLVNQIRERVKAWRDAEYPGISGITRRLLEYWNNPEEFENRRFFFCQLEAVETLIWLTEAPATDKMGVDISSDGGAFQRLCAKMATGTGKTVVMAMVIAWHILNKLGSPRDIRFSKHILIIAPGLTVRNRLAVLDPSHLENYYKLFRIVPPAMFDKLRQGKIVIRNWHALNWENQKKIIAKRTVDKRGLKSDEAYVRDVLGDMARARNILVINDEAHHAWRIPANSKIKGVPKADIEEATKWIGGLDRINRARGINMCYDFSATPFSPSSKRNPEEALFSWIVSDFGLNDAIESGLVKTPRVVIRDDAIPDANTYKSRLYHIYEDHDVKDDLNRKARPEEPLPDLVVNGYYLLGYDWRETAKIWNSHSSVVPPVMITVANRTETAARIKYAFDHHRIHIDELCNPKRTLHIDSKALKIAEATGALGVDSNNGADENEIENASENKASKEQQAELLRMQVGTVGQLGKSGEQIQNVISVGMLSEGWDAKTVTHIMGLRAFTSQLLCEQVVGRGLRRTSYEINPKTKLFEPEYVNIFGVPFTFLPHEGGENDPPPPPSPKTEIKPLAEKENFAITWPNIIRIDYRYHPNLSLDWQSLQALELDANQTARLVELAPIVDGKPDTTKIREIDLEQLAREFRTQRIVFEVARDVYDQMQSTWGSNKISLLRQLVCLIERFIKLDFFVITPIIFKHDDLRRRLLITLNMTKVAQYIRDAIRFDNTESLEPVFDREQPIVSTADMRKWFTGKPCEPAVHSHINFCVYDSSWEASEAFVLDRAPEVAAWVKNDHLGFEIFYIYRGVIRKYRPDFLIRFLSGNMLVLEVKGRDLEQDKIKRRFLDEWVRSVNAYGGFGYWSWDVSKNPADIYDILARHSQTHIT